MFRKLGIIRGLWEKEMSGAVWLRFSADGEFLAVWAQDWVKLWKLAGTEPFVIMNEKRHGGFGFDMVLDISPDSRMSAVGRKEGSVGVYDLTSRLQIRELQVGAEPRHLAFHPTQRQLAIAFSDRVQVRDRDTGNKTAEFLADALSI